MVVSAPKSIVQVKTETECFSGENRLIYQLKSNIFPKNFDRITKINRVEYRRKTNVLASKSENALLRNVIISAWKLIGQSLTETEYTYESNRTMYQVYPNALPNTTIYVLVAACNMINQFSDQNRGRLERKTNNLPNSTECAREKKRLYLCHIVFCCFESCRALS